MKLASLLLASIGMSVAGGSAFIAHDYMETRTIRAVAEQSPDLVEVMVAAEDINFGQPISAQLLTVRTWPRDAMPEGAFNAMSYLIPDASQEPRRARSSIVRGQPILADHVSEFGEKVTIVQTLGENNRAVAITVSAETSAGGFVTPGDYVDVILTRGSAEDLRAITILQNIRVIAVDQDANERSDTPSVSRTVTVEVSPEQGQALALVQRAGRLSLMLRDFNADDDQPMRTLRLSDILLEETPDIPEVAVARRTITVRRGLDTEIVAADGDS